MLNKKLNYVFQQRQRYFLIRRHQERAFPWTGFDSGWLGQIGVVWLFCRICEELKISTILLCELSLKDQPEYSSANKYSVGCCCGASDDGGSACGLISWWVCCSSVDVDSSFGARRSSSVWVAEASCWCTWDFRPYSSCISGFCLDSYGGRVSLMTCSTHDYLIFQCFIFMSLPPRMLNICDINKLQKLQIIITVTTTTTYNILYLHVFLKIRLMKLVWNFF